MAQLERHAKTEEYLYNASKQVESHHALRLDTLLANHRLSGVGNLADCGLKLLILLAVEFVTDQTLNHILVQTIESARLGHQRVPILNVLVIAPRLIPQNGSTHTDIASPRNSCSRILGNLRNGCNHIFGSRCSPLLVQLLHLEDLAVEQLIGRTLIDQGLLQLLGKRGQELSIFFFHNVLTKMFRV